MAGAQSNIRSFLASPRGAGRLTNTFLLMGSIGLIGVAGKTAPSFLEDLNLYDPLYPPTSGLNILRDQPLNHVAFGSIAQLLPATSCRHSFILKSRQSSPPALDERPSPTSTYKVAALCRSCRRHVLLAVDYSIRWDGDPCPNEQSPLHHLVHSPWRESLARNQWLAQYPESQDEIYTFECSSSTCSAMVFVHLSPPVVSAEAVHVLTAKDLLKQRTDDAFRTKAGHVEGMKHPSPIDVLIDLRKYIQNTWTKDVRSIRLDNKRFMVRFGPEGRACKEVLESLGFTFKVRRPDFDSSHFT